SITVRQLSLGTGGGNKVASNTEAKYKFKFCAATSGKPYLKRITSPCSVVRKRPATEPGGCDSIASWAGPPPRPTVPPRPWNNSSSICCCSHTATSSSWARYCDHAAAVVPASFAESE